MAETQTPSEALGREGSNFRWSCIFNPLRATKQHTGEVVALQANGIKEHGFRMSSVGKTHDSGDCLALVCQ